MPALEGCQGPSEQESRPALPEASWLFLFSAGGKGPPPEKIPPLGKEWLPRNDRFLHQPLWVSQPASSGQVFQKQVAVASFPGLSGRDWPCWLPASGRARIHCLWVLARSLQRLTTSLLGPRKASFTQDLLRSARAVARSSEFLRRTRNKRRRKSGPKQPASFASLERGQFQGCEDGMGRPLLLLPPPSPAQLLGKGPALPAQGPPSSRGKARGAGRNRVASPRPGRWKPPAWAGGAPSLCALPCRG